MRNPQAFYNNEDIWELARVRPPGRTAAPRAGDAHLCGGDVARGNEAGVSADDVTFTPQKQRESDRRDAGALRRRAFGRDRWCCELSKQELTLGPMQISGAHQSGSEHFERLDACGISRGRRCCAVRCWCCRWNNSVSLRGADLYPGHRSAHAATPKKIVLGLGKPADLLPTRMSKRFGGMLNGAERYRAVGRRAARIAAGYRESANDVRVSRKRRLTGNDATACKAFAITSIAICRADRLPGKLVRRRARTGEPSKRN